MRHFGLSCMTMKFATISGLGIALAACATPPAPAITSFTPTAVCTPDANIMSARALTPPVPAGRYELVVPIDAATPCLQQVAAGTSAPYVVFELPNLPNTASINAGGVIEPLRVVGPRVFTLDTSGQFVRQFDQAQLQHRGQTQSVLFRPQADERFVVVAVDAGMVGQRMPFTVALPDQGQADEGISTPLLPGVEYSYEGMLFARAYFFEPTSGDASAD